MSARLCSMCTLTQESMKAHSLKQRGQMSDVNQLESSPMTFTWSVSESCWWANITATSARKQLWDKLRLLGLEGFDYLVLITRIYTVHTVPAQEQTNCMYISNFLTLYNKQETEKLVEINQHQYFWSLCDQTRINDTGSFQFCAGWWLKKKKKIWLISKDSNKTS